MTFQSNVFKTFDKIVRILQPNNHHEMGNLIKIFFKIREKIPKFLPKKSVFQIQIDKIYLRTSISIWITDFSAKMLKFFPNFHLKNLNFRPKFWSKDDFCSRFTSVYTWITYSKIYKGMPDQVDMFLTFLSPRKKPKSRKFSKKVRSLNFKAKIFVTYQIMFSRIFVKNVQFRSNYRFKVLCEKKWPMTRDLS